MNKVHIVGAGIAGLTAAHELADQGGFEIHVHEVEDHIGGKAASQPMNVAGVTADALGEHGFRFFPWFYLHLPHTLKRIPLGANEAGSVHGMLREATFGGVAYEQGLYSIAREAGPMDALALVQTFFMDLDVDPIDMAKYAFRLGRFWTACEERKTVVYENMSWAEYIGVNEAGYYTPRFAELVRSIPLMLVAMRSDEGSARTIGHAAIQLMVDIDPATNDLADAVLAAPTSHSWMKPWKAHLDSLGVRFHFGRKLEQIRLNAASDRVAEIGFADGTIIDVSSDQFVCALPLEGIAPLLPQISHADPALRTLEELCGSNPAPLRDMVGVQYALRDDVPLVHGHVAFAGTDWSLTAVSQSQFWTEVGPSLDEYFGVEGLRGVISAIVSDWETPVSDPNSPVHGKAARNCTEPELLREVWRQMRVTLRVGDLADETQGTPWMAAHLDRNVTLTPFVNRSPLLVHPPGSYLRRPQALVAGVHNLALASDYVRTTTDIATMEGANEAGRRAAYAVLSRTGSAASPRFFEFELGFDRERELDRWRWQFEKPHLYDATTLDDLDVPDRADSSESRDTKVGMSPIPQPHPTMRRLLENARAALPALQEARASGDPDALRRWRERLLEGVAE